MISALRLAVLTYLLLLITFHVPAQTLKGIVIDAETAQPLSAVSVVNVSTGQSTTSNNSGRFSIPAKRGETLSYSLFGYRAVRYAAGSATEETVELTPLSVRLKEYILQELTPFQRDSIELTTLYSKELNTEPIRPGFSTANGGGFTGLIGGPVQRMSKSYKQNQQFKENFKRDMEQRYIDTRYTPALVATLTSLSGDALPVFMNSYPMEYGFARTASDLEIKAWIRNNYKEYLKRDR
jgi:hypothetical protein